MLKTLKRAHNRFFGIGEADTSVPVLDGALKPNNVLETAQVFFDREGLDDMVVADNGQLIVACGHEIIQLAPDGTQSVIAHLPAPAQALAVFRDGLVAATQEGLSFITGSLDGKQVGELNGQAVQCINALHEGPDGSLLISQGSSTTSYADWAADLLKHGKSGRVLAYDPLSGSCQVKAQGLAYCYGVCFDGNRVIASETWAHRLRIIEGDAVRIGPSQIAGYPSRISLASDGGFWLTIFAPRSQLLEFVLREDDFRNEMMQTIAPKYWIAPALSSGSDFLEPLQQGGVRQMGILKPWAPPRSYGLVLRLSKDLEPLYSVHSRVGGLHHGITAALEFDGALLALSKGSGRILRVPLSNWIYRTDTMTAILELQQATKRYGGVPAIDGVDFNLMKGEIHALCGENGAGKSTLTKVMAGVVELSGGEMRIDGKPVSFRNPVEALSAGVAMVFQETSLVPTMTVGQNLFLGKEKFVNRLRAVYIAAQQLLQSLNFNVDPTHMVSNLGAAQKQMVEIARAVLHDARVIIFDEPTATLTPEEKKYFFDLMKNLKARGVSIIFISHALEEALELSDRITVMRDGKHIVTDDTANFDRDRIVRSMVGRDLTSTLYGQKTTLRPAGKRVLSVQNLRMGTMVRNTSFSIFAGQITGVFGLIGSGRTETFKVVAGVLKRDYTHGGKVVFKDQAVRYRVPVPAMEAGIAYITEDRKVDGFFETMTISRNIYMGRLAKLRRKGQLLSRSQEKSVGADWKEKLNVRAVTENAHVIELSGGNQQKVVIAKSLIQEPELIIFDEPTRGVDVGAVAEIHDIIRGLADQGLAVVVISSYLPEVMMLSDRILVSRQGRIVEEFTNSNVTEEEIMYASIH